jgi:protein gp37
MGENTKIEWATHTFNPWTGCTKVSPACDHCYAEGWAKRSGMVEWGPGKSRRRTSAANWKDPLKWNRQAAETGVRPRVFCASLADVFDNEVPDQWRRDLWALIRSTPNLDWLIVTKRIGNATRMLPADWGEGWPHVWLLITVCNQPEADRDIPKLLRTPAQVRGLSLEPLLGSVNIGRWLQHWTFPLHISRDNVPNYKDQILDWVIVGGESGPNARPMQGDWARALRDQCQAVGVPFLFKQWGEWADADNAPQEALDGLWNAHKGKDDLERRGLIQDVPQKPSGPPHFGCNYTVRIGKKAAGRLLDGRTWDEFPNSST